jgi:hypothetical protein
MVYAIDIMREGEGPTIAAATAAALSAASPATHPSSLPSSTSHSFLAFQYFIASAVNATSYMSPTPNDLILAIPRLAKRVGTFAFSTIPEHVDGILANRYHMRIIPDATNQHANFATATNPAEFLQARDTVGSAAGLAPGPLGEATGAAGGFGGGLGLNSVRGFGGILSYLTSKWAMSCFTMVQPLPRQRG